MPFDMFAAFREKRPERTKRMYRAFGPPWTWGVTTLPPVDAFAAGLVPVGSYKYPYKPSQNAITQSRRYEIGDSYMRRMLDALVDGACGKDGIRYIFRNETAQAAWDSWAWNRAAPYERFDDLQRAMVRAVVRDGEAFYDVVSDREGTYVVEIDPLNVGIEGGIEYDESGRATSYLIKNQDTELASRVSAERIIHVYRHDFPQQRRGLSWVATSIPFIDKLRDVEHYMVTAFRNIAQNPYFYKIGDDVYRNLPSTPTGDTPGNRLDLEAGLGDEEPPEFPDADTAEDYPNPIQYLTDPDGVSRMAVAGEMEVEMMGLPPGLRTAEFAELKRSQLTRIAKTAGLSYQAVYGDIRDANYSSMRHAMLQDQATYRRIQRIVEVGMQGIYDRWVVAMRMEQPGLDLEIDRIVYPTWESIDPEKDANTDVKLVEAKLYSRQELMRARGADPAKVFEEIAEEAELIQEMTPAPAAEDGESEEGESPPVDDGDDEEAN